MDQNKIHGYFNNNNLSFTFQKSYIISKIDKKLK